MGYWSIQFKLANESWYNAFKRNARDEHRTLYLILDIPGSGRSSQEIKWHKVINLRGKPVVVANSVSNLMTTY